MNTNTMILLIVIGILAILNIIPRKKESSNDSKNIKIYPYKQKLLLTKTEYEFYNILKSKCDSYNLIICPKVRLEDFVTVSGTKEVMKYRGYIKSRHIDFLICDDKLHIKAGLELDDNSHNKAAAQKTDEFKNKLFATIGIKLFRVKALKSNYETEITKIIADLTTPVNNNMVKGI